MPVITDIEFDFPFPQVFKGSEITILADKTEIYSVNNRTGLLSLFEVWDARTGTKRTIPEGSSWQFADMHNYWLLNNGRCTIFARGQSNLDTRPVVYCEDKIAIEAVASYNTGQEILGGFEMGKFWSDENWQNLFRAWATNFPDDFDMSIPMGENFVFWSTIGEAALPWLISVTEATTGSGLSGAYTAPQYHSATSTPGNRLHDMMKRNEWGFMPMPWQGKVRHIKKLGKFLMVYGDNGVTAMFPSDSTFGLKDLAHIPGIASRNAVAGDENQHVFIDRLGALWSITNEGANRLGYEEFFAPMMGTDIVVSYDKHLREWYIANKKQAFVYTGIGLGQISQLISSTVILNGVRTGTYTETGQDAQEIVTNPTDFGVIGRKKIFQLSAGMHSSGLNQAGAYYRYQAGEDWRFKDLRRLNGYGALVINCTGQEFMIALRMEPYAKCELRSLNVEWELEDKRFVRSAYGYPGALSSTT